MKVLRATAMLDGAYAAHDFDHMPVPPAEAMRHELCRRADPYHPPLDSGRFWTYLADGLHRFDVEFSRQRAYAVNYSRYATTSSGRVVARHNQAAHHVACAMAAAWPDCANPRALATVMAQAWKQHVGWYGTRTPPDPQDYFAAHQGTINHHLFAMKVHAV